MIKRTRRSEAANGKFISGRRETGDEGLWGGERGKEGRQGPVSVIPAQAATMCQFAGAALRTNQAPSIAKSSVVPFAPGRKRPRNDGCCYAFPLTAHRSPLTAHRSPLTAHRSPLTAHRSPLTAPRPPPTAHRSPLAAHRLPPTAPRQPRTRDPITP